MMNLKLLNFLFVVTSITSTPLFANAQNPLNPSTFPNVENLMIHTGSRSFPFYVEPKVGDQFEMPRPTNVDHGSDWLGENGYRRIKITGVSPSQIAFVDEKGIEGTYSKVPGLTQSVNSLSRYGYTFKEGETLYYNKSNIFRTKLVRIGVIEKLFANGNIYVRNENGETALWNSIHLVDLDDPLLSRMESGNADTEAKSMRDVRAERALRVEASPEVRVEKATRAVRY